MHLLELHITFGNPAFTNSRQLFEHHGEDLYDELKHIRNSTLEIRRTLENAETSDHTRSIAVLQRTHSLLQRQIRRKKQPADSKQMTLF